MDVRELVEQAAQAAGTHTALALELGMHQNRLAEWKKGKRRPDANELAYMADRAGLPVLETVAEIEAQLNDRFSDVWRHALGKLKAAGVAASLAGVGLIALPSHEAKAATLDIARVCTDSGSAHGSMPICSDSCASS